MRSNQWECKNPSRSIKENWYVRSTSPFIFCNGVLCKEKFCAFPFRIMIQIRVDAATSSHHAEHVRRIFARMFVLTASSALLCAERCREELTVLPATMYSPLTPTIEDSPTTNAFFGAFSRDCAYILVQCGLRKCGRKIWNANTFSWCLMRCFGFNSPSVIANEGVRQNFISFSTFFRQLSPHFTKCFLAP